MQLADAPDPANAQLLLGVKVPGWLLVKPIVPVGVIAVPAPTSAMVAVHCVEPVTATEAGLQFKLVEVER